MKIVVGLDGSDCAGRALAWAIAEAKRCEAEIVAVHVFDLPLYPNAIFPAFSDEMDTWRKELDRVLEDEWCAPLREAGVRYRALLEEGPVAARLNERARAEEAELVVVGRRGRGSVREFFAGSVSHELTHHCHVPVVIVPAA